MKKLVALLVLVGFVFAAALPVMAEDAAECGKDQPVKDVAQYTGNVAVGSVKTVGTAAKETTETGVSPLVALWRSLTGKGKPEKVVTDPIEKGGKTVVNATVNTGKTVVGQNGPESK